MWTNNCLHLHHCLLSHCFSINVNEKVTIRWSIASAVGTIHTFRSYAVCMYARVHTWFMHRDLHVFIHKPREYWGSSYTEHRINYSLCLLHILGDQRRSPLCARVPGHVLKMYQLPQSETSQKQMQIFIPPKNILDTYIRNALKGTNRFFFLLHLQSDEICCVPEMKQETKKYVFSCSKVSCWGDSGGKDRCFPPLVNLNADVYTFWRTSSKLFIKKCSPVNFFHTIQHHDCLWKFGIDFSLVIVLTSQCMAEPTAPK